MIVVTLDLKSAISDDRSRRLGTVLIANEGGDRRRANYDVRATRDGKRVYNARVEAFPRGSRSALELLRRALNALHEKGELP